MNHDELEEDNRIDPDALDVECIAQPEKFWKWSRLSIEARSRVDEAKMALDSKEAFIALDCRNNPERYGIPKVTESSIEAIVKRHDDYLALTKKLIAAKEEAAHLDQAVRTMEMRKRMLELLVTLHGQSYFAGPTVPRKLGEMVLKQRERSEKRIVERQKLHTRKRGS